MAEVAQRRRDELLKILRSQAAASNRYLSDRLGVSQSTVRRDLDALEEQGFVARIHGSARLLRFNGREMDKRELSFYGRCKTAVHEKQAIAQAALQFLKPDSVVMLDASTSCFYFAQAIPDDLSLTVITHSAYIPVEVAGKPNLQVISTGGVLHSRSLCYLGAEAECNSQHLHAHQAFFGAKGITLREGCTDASPLEVQLKATMLNEAHELIILADHTKIGNIALASFAPLSRVRILITDELAAPDIVDAIREAGTQVVTAPLTASPLSQ